MKVSCAEGLRNRGGGLASWPGGLSGNLGLHSARQAGASDCGRSPVLTKLFVIKIYILGFKECCLWSLVIFFPFFLNVKNQVT